MKTVELQLYKCELNKKKILQIGLPYWRFRFSANVMEHLRSRLTISKKTSINTFKYHVLEPMGRFQLELIYHYIPPYICMFLSCRPFVVITTLSTGLIGVEVTSVSWLGQLTVGV